MLDSLPIDLFVGLAMPHVSETHLKSGLYVFLYILGVRKYHRLRSELLRLLNAPPSNQTSMFPLQNRQIGGYLFKQRTWYTREHLGVDYRAPKGTPLRAPFKGRIVKVVSGAWLQGGTQVYYQPDHDAVMMRFMHLDRVIKTVGEVQAGDIIALTGNTGIYTTGDHLHLDIATNWTGTYWTNVNNFIDPETYNWDYAPVTVHVPIEVAPIPLVSGFPRKVQALVRLKVRTSPNTTAPLAEPWIGAPIINGSPMALLVPGDELTALGSVEGGSYTILLNGRAHTSTLWLKSKQGNYLAALGTNFTNQ